MVPCVLGSFCGKSENPQAAFKCAAQKWRLAAAGEEFISGTMTRLQKKQPRGFILPFRPDTTGWGGCGGREGLAGHTCVCEWGGGERERLGPQQPIQSIRVIIQSAGCGPFITVLILFSFLLSSGLFRQQ